MADVKEKDLVTLFGTLVEDLTEKIRGGEATGKDKEIALHLVKAFNIGLTKEQAQPLDDLEAELPFADLHPN